MSKKQSKPKRPAKKKAGGDCPSASCSAVLARIKAYLTTGGAFNPELADHVAVRDLLIDCRDVMMEMQKGKRWVTPSLPLAPNCRL
jgi:hypothetical protein